MTSTTYTAPVALDPAAFTGMSTVSMMSKIKQFTAVLFGVNSDKPDYFRGLDLNGNAMWSTQHSR